MNLRLTLSQTRSILIFSDRHSAHLKGTLAWHPGIEFFLLFLLVRDCSGSLLVFCAVKFVVLDFDEDGRNRVDIAYWVIDTGLIDTT